METMVHEYTRQRNEILNHFKYDHLPIHLQEISKPFCDLAIGFTNILPERYETVVMLRKILEAKDCAVRSFLLK